MPHFSKQELRSLLHKLCIITCDTAEEYSNTMKEFDRFIAGVDFDSYSTSKKRAAKAVAPLR